MSDIFHKHGTLIVTRDEAGYTLFSPVSIDPVLNNDEAESLALALLDDLGKGWRPYPENAPEIGLYDVTAEFDSRLVVRRAVYNSAHKWYDEKTCKEITGIVIAYRELPAPFQPEEQ